jgi:6-phosphogluconolactonase (cycloisomerase 2 family)
MTHKSRKIYSNFLIPPIGAIALSLAGLATFGQQSFEEEYKFGSIDFAGRYIAALSDGDFSTHIDGKLSTASGIATDKLSIIPLPLDGSKKPAVQINVSNAVRSSIPIATSPDGKTIFVVETLGQAKGVSNRSLPLGNKLAAVDLSDLGLPLVTDTIQVGQNPKSISVNPQGDLLAIPTQIGQKITFVPVQKNKFGTPKSFPIIGIQADCKKSSEITHIEWHPNGRYIAAVMQARNQVIFYKVERNDADIKLVAWGKPVEVENPFSGKFTPDGRFFITNNVQRFFDTQTQPDYESAKKHPKALSVIRLANEQNTPSNAKHQIVSSAVADVFPQGMAISTDGDLIATANKLVTSYAQDKDTKNLSQNFSVSLFKLDLQAGHLTKVAESRAEGMLPKGIHFDASGDHLAIAVSDYLKPKKTGGIEIWRIARSDKFALERTNQIINVGKGTHAVVVW